MSVINIKGLSVSYAKKRVLTNIFLDIESSHIYGILGPNGAGKSTFFKALLGILKNYQGQITFFDESIEEIRNRIAYVPQRDDVDWQFPATVLDIVLIGRYPHKKFWQKISKTDLELARKALEDVGMLEYEDRQIEQLSGGQQQRVFIARALCQGADIFLLDEPFVGVDVMTEDKIITILKNLAQQGKTVLVVHHDLESVRSYFDKVILINQRLIAYGNTESTFTDANIAKTFGAQLIFLHNPI